MFFKHLVFGFLMCLLWNGSSYVQLPAELKSSNKGLTKIKNDDQKHFFVVSCFTY